MATSIATDDQSTYERSAFPEDQQAVGSGMRFQSCTTVEGRPSVSTGCMPANRVVPIIFVSGIMGSNLKAKAEILNGDRKVVIQSDTPVWRVDGTIGLVWNWVAKPQDQYQLRFQYDKVTVDDRGEIAVKSAGDAPGRTKRAGLTEEEARARGWGTVSAVFYGEFLDWLDSQLNQAQRDMHSGKPVDNQMLTHLKQVAMCVDQAVAAGNLLMRDAGYSHDASYEVGGKSEGHTAALQAIVRVLKAEVTA